MKHGLIVMGWVLMVSPVLAMECQKSLTAYHQREMINVPFLAADREQRTTTTSSALVRDHAIDCLIASLFLVGSGIPGIPSEVQCAANVSASVLWLGDSSLRLFGACKKWRAGHDGPIPPLQEVVIE